MNIDVPLRELGAIPMEDLRDAILAQDEAAWVENATRQDSYEVHRQTRSIVLVFCDNKWPRAHRQPRGRLGPALRRRGARDAGAHPSRLPAGRNHHPGHGRAAARRAAGLPRISTPTRAFRVSHRIHVPITTNPRVRFMIDGRPYQLHVGQAYELNNQLTHSVTEQRPGRPDHVHFRLPAARRHRARPD